MPRESPLRSTRRVARLGAGSLMVLVGVVTACGGDDGSDGSASEATSGSSAGTTAETTTSTTAGTTTTTRPRAADGSDVAACADGNCEVAVSGPVDIPLAGHSSGITQLSVTEITSDGFGFTTTSNGGGTGSGSLGEGCISVLTNNSMSSQCSSGQALEPPREPGTLAIQLADASGTTAVLRLVSG